MEAFSGASVRHLKDYSAKQAELDAYLTGRWLTDLANFSAFVFHSLPDLNWAGFYLYDGSLLRLGPFVGKPACTEIRPGRGVCGTAFAQREALIVPDVHEFPGHITCDTASRSELVIPLAFGAGVLDLDSPLPARFTEEDRVGLARWLELLPKKIPSSVWEARPWA